ncbi:MAG: hypothetical protein WAV52_11220, partial [Luteococcus japonicus]
MAYRVPVIFPSAGTVVVGEGLALADRDGVTEGLTLGVAVRLGVAFFVGVTEAAGVLGRAAGLLARTDALGFGVATAGRAVERLIALA